MSATLWTTVVLIGSLCGGSFAAESAPPKSQVLIYYANEPQPGQYNQIIEWLEQEKGEDEKALAAVKRMKEDMREFPAEVTRNVEAIRSHFQNASVGRGAVIVSVHQGHG